jgi:hypothetical protein
VRGLGEPPDLRLDLFEGFRSDVPHNGDDEALLGLDGDPDVVPVEVDEVVAVDPRVQLGELRECAGHGLQGQRQELLDVDVREVALLDPRDRRDLAVRPGEVLEHLPLDAADRLAPAVTL